MKIRNAATHSQLAARVKAGIFYLTHSAKLTAPLSARDARCGVLVVFAALVAVAFFAGPLALSAHEAWGDNSNDAVSAAGKASAGKKSDVRKVNHLTAGLGRSDTLSAAGVAFGLLSPTIITSPGTIATFQSSETIATFQSNDCQTPKTTWNLGEAVCARVIGATGPRRIAWFSPNGFIAQVSNTFTGTGSDLYTIPVGADPFAQVGTWAVRILNSDGDAINDGDAPGTPGTALFVIRNPQIASADLSLINSVDTEVAGSISYTVTAFNLGPDSAQNVRVTDAAPANITLVSATSDSTAFTCSGGTCTGATLAANDKATFTFVYSVPTGTSIDTLTNTASVSSDTSEPDSQKSDNNSIAQITAGSAPTGGGGGCTITCPANIVQNKDLNQDGANVSFAATASGSCGTVTYDPPAGFFPIGTTQVTASDGATSCDFTVTVTDPGAITITLNPPPGTCPDETTGTPGPCPSSPLTVECQTNFTDPGATATNGQVTTQVVCSDEDGTFSCPFDKNKPGTYTFIYTATNGTQTATATRTVNVVDSTPPVITLNGANPLIVECHMSFTDPGAMANDSCAGSFAATASGSVDVNTPGTYTITYRATDSSDNESAPVTRTVNVVDTTPPVITLVGANPLTVECHTSFTDPGASGTDACVGSVAVTTSGSVNVNAPGSYTITYTATDGANPVTRTRTVNVVDTTAPVIACPANVNVYLPLNSTATSMVVNYTAPTATDTCGGVSVTSTLASGSVFPVGTTTVTATATDASGNTSSCSFTVTVLYNFTGFFSPIGNLPVLNTVNAGRAIPVKFSLSGNKGLNIFATGSPTSGQNACNDTAPTVEAPTDTAGQSSLSYEAGSDQYNYVWKTEQAWAGTCRQLIITLKDGSVHVANFKFR